MVYCISNSVLLNGGERDNSGQSFVAATLLHFFGVFSVLQDYCLHVTIQHMT